MQTPGLGEARACGPPPAALPSPRGARGSGTAGKHLAQGAHAAPAPRPLPPPSRIPGARAPPAGSARGRGHRVAASHRGLRLPTPHSSSRDPVSAPQRLRGPAAVAKVTGAFVIYKPFKSSFGREDPEKGSGGGGCWGREQFEEKLNFMLITR